MTKKKTGGGRFNPLEEQVYFLAGTHLRDIGEVHRYNLLATNDMNNAKEIDLEGRLDEGNTIFFDSGVFWLTQRHMKKHPGMTMDEALSLPPDQVDGFDWLWDLYIETVRKYEDRLWGYIELDQGGAENKRKTRAKLEALGLRPIPVYHPLNDGWDYFDELCEQYDRICFGNIVQANPKVRKHLMATLWERRRKYPDVWVHVLGLTPNELTTVYPPSSSDSSSWVFAVMFGAQNSPGAHAMGDSFGKFTTTFSYDPSTHRDSITGSRQGVYFLASEAYFMQALIRSHQRDLKRVFGEDALLPPRDEREGIRA